MIITQCLAKVPVHSSLTSRSATRDAIPLLPFFPSHFPASQNCHCSTRPSFSQRAHADRPKTPHPGPSQVPLHSSPTRNLQPSLLPRQGTILNSRLDSARRPRPLSTAISNGAPTGQAGRARRGRPNQPPPGIDDHFRHARDPIFLFL